MKKTTKCDICEWGGSHKRMYYDGSGLPICRTCIDAVLKIVSPTKLRGP